jgi:proteasome assembly chaperone (PAC2) family protein
MSDLIELWEKPTPGKYMVAGWYQWADAGSISSGLPQYLIDEAQARKIGEIKPHGFYLFQIPGTHHLLRPVVKLDGGHRETLQERRNEFFCTGDDGQGFLIFLGEEPHQHEAQYAEAFFDVVQALGVKRVAAVAGVYGAVPYDKNREVSSVYSLPGMKDELAKYAVRFSNYEGGATMSMYLAHRAEARGIEFFRLCAFVPSYDFLKSSAFVQRMAMEEDFKAWYDLMTRLNHMFKLDMDLSDLEGRSNELVAEWEAKIDHLARAMPELNVRAYMEQVNGDFTEVSFVPLSGVWEEELGHLFEDL